MVSRIHMVLDRIAHHSTKDKDLESSIAGLRRLLKGKLPSEVLVLKDDGPTMTPKHRSYDAWQEEIDQLHSKLTELESLNAASEREKNRLRAQIDKLRDQLNQYHPSGTLEYYTYEQVIQIMVMKFGKHHGVPAALTERNAQMLRRGADVNRITSSGFQVWRKENRYPAFVVEQIKEMTANDLLPRGKWTESERQFLAQLYSSNERLSNKALADACSVQFGRLVTECSIKGELNRLRQRGKVSAYRQLKAPV